MRRRLLLASMLAATLAALELHPQGQTSSHQVLVDLQPEGGTPEAGLLRASDGRLYGTSCRGGQYGDGSIYLWDPMAAAGSEFQTVFSFRRNTNGACPMAGLMLASDGLLYGTTFEGGPPTIFNDGAGTIFRIDADTGALDVLHTFRPAGTGYPKGELLEHAGDLYGTTTGAAAPGEVFRFAIPAPGDPATLQTLHTFTGGADGYFPTGALVHLNGWLYGTTQFGGAVSNRGTVFAINPSVASGGHSVVVDLDSVGLFYPRGGLVVVGNRLYGAVQQPCLAAPFPDCGAVMRIDPATGATDVAFTMGLGSPAGPLMLASDGALYGTGEYGGTSGEGVIFRLDPTTWPTVSIHASLDRGTTGAHPRAGLIENAGVLYGTATAGGPGNAGTVFTVPTVPPSGGSVTPVHSFGPVAPHRPASGLTLIGNNLYGIAGEGGLMSAGAVIRHTLGTTAIDSLHDFGTTTCANPPDGRVSQGSGVSVARFDTGTLAVGSTGVLFGVTPFNTDPNGNGRGTIFSINPDGTGCRVLRHFYAGSADGETPVSELLPVNGVLYGTTSLGGAFGQGSVFAIDEDGMNFRVLHAFNGLGPFHPGGVATDGARSTAGLVAASDGYLYGSTYYGGANGQGSIFRLLRDGTGFSVVHSFGAVDPRDGAFPSSALVEGRPGEFFGVAPGNGLANGGGAVFRLDMTTTPPTFTSLKAFTNFSVNADGTYPVGPLVRGAGHWYYGTTILGGPSRGGTAFAISRTGQFRLLTTFDAANARQNARLTLAPDGSFYGVTPGGGQNGGGTIFRIAQDADADSVLDGIDNCPLVANLAQTDANGDGVGDACNAVPVANDSAVATTVNVAVAVPLTATDADGTPITYRLVTQPARGTLSGTAPALTYTPNAGSNGSDSFTWVANDGSADSNVATVSIAVRVINQAPVAFNQSIVATDGISVPVVLGGSDPDGDSLTFAIVNQPAHGSVVLTGSTATYFVNGYTGPDSFQFRANDGTLDSNIATITIDVRPPNRPPVANPGGPYTADLGVPIMFDGRASSDPDSIYGDVVQTYFWRIGPTNAQTMLTGAQPTLSGPEVTALGPGTHVVSLSVYDASGSVSVAATTTLTVRGPVASFTALPNPAACGQTVVFDASASASARPGRTITTFAWSFSDGQTASGQSTSRAFPAFGGYTASLTVTDDLGFSATSQQTVNVSVGNRAPVAIAGGPYFTPADTAVTLSSAGSLDPDSSCGDRIARYDWTVGTLTLTGATPTLSAFDVSTLGRGVFPVQLRVTDTFGLSRTASTTLTVQSPVFTLTITRQGAGSGTVTSTPAGIDCGTDCTESYPQNTVVQLQATPAPGSFFVRWSGSPGCSTGNVSMTADSTCTATFNSTSRPDLIVESWVPPSFIPLDTDAMITVTVRNTSTSTNAGPSSVGVIAARFSFQLGRLVVSQIGTIAVGPLAAGDSVTVDVPVRIPRNFPTGLALLVAAADAGNTVAETNEFNNGRTATFSVR